MRPMTYAAGAATEETGPTATKVQPGEAQVRVMFFPPEKRQVGEHEVGAVVLESNADVPHVVLKVEPGGALRVTNAQSAGALYSGPLRANRRRTVPVVMVAEKPGPQNLRVTLSSREPVANAQMDIKVGSFARAAPAASPPPLPKPTGVTLVFRETEIRDALIAVGNQAGVNVVLAPDVGGQRVNVDLVDIPVRAALRILCEGAGYRVQPDDGGYRVTRP